ncbi:MAG: TIR domain-containing protein [Planctomycetota bacterium]|nr:MAG: TIR domain-containing protein [Planctomycetota bacterium]
MANPKHLDLLKQGRKAVLQWRQKHPDKMLDLTDADLRDFELRGLPLRNADLVGSDLSGCDLMGTSFSGADLTRARLEGCRLIKADLYAATLFKASFAGADLSGAYLRRVRSQSVDFGECRLVKADLRDGDFSGSCFVGARLLGADLTRAVVDGADFSRAEFGWTILASMDIHEAVGLQDVRHVGPSSIGIDTLYRSQVAIPVEFLQAAGVAQPLLDRLAELRGEPLHAARFFIRHVREESAFAQKLHEALQAAGLRCWLDLRPPKQPTGQVDFELPDDLILMCASKYSLTSWWCEETIETALKREQQFARRRRPPRCTLFPLSLDGFMFSGDWQNPHEKQIAQRAIDFVGWRRNATKFEQSLAVLLERIREALAAD